MWRNSSRSIDHVSVSFLWTKKFNKDYLPVIEIWIISFLTDKFMYPCVSFVYLSLISLSVLLFKIFNFRFHVFLTGLFPHAFWRLSLFGTTLVRDRFDSRVYICRIFLFFSFQVIQQLRYVFSWTFVCRDLQLAKDSHGGEADCKELVNPWWVIRQFFTDGSPTPYGYTAGVRPIKVASLGT